MRPEVHREIARLMTQMRRLCSLAVNKRLSVVGCSLHEYAVLFRLVHDSEVPQHELAYDAAIDPAAVSRLVRDMVKSGLVTTRVDPTDKRQRFVKATVKGRALERTLSPVIDAELEPLLSGLSVEEERQFLRLLQKSYQHAVSMAAGLASEARASVGPRAAALEPAADEPLGRAASLPPNKTRRNAR
jgi:DNA-binding MarR family transcriptional regulator